MTRTMVLAGTYTRPILFGTGEVLDAKGKGIYLYELLGGELHLRSIMEAVNPSFLITDRAGKRLYTTNELKEWQGRRGGAVSAYAMDLERGQLTHLNTVASIGTDPCHLALSPGEDTLYCANYMSGSTAAFPIRQDGSLENASFFAQHEGSGPDPVRQRSPHAHGTFLSPDGKWLYVPDLGKDTLLCYAIEKQTLRPCPERDIRMPDPGGGARHMAFHPDGRHLYVDTEMGNRVVVFDYDGESGRAEPKQSLSTLPEGADNASSAAAALRIHPGGRLLFISNRGHDSIASWRIDPETGLLSRRSVFFTGGHIPREFAVSPSGDVLIAAHQSGNDLGVFSLDPESGRMSLLSRTEIPCPVCVQILETGA